MLAQAVPLLRPQGRLLILTPTGTGHWRATDLWQHWSLHLWRLLTAGAGRRWQVQQLAADFAHEHDLTYRCQPTFANGATLEVLTTH
jgi:hypothetical protein